MQHRGCPCFGRSQEAQIANCGILFFVLGLRLIEYRFLSSRLFKIIVELKLFLFEAFLPCLEAKGSGPDCGLSLASVAGNVQL